MAVIVYIIIAWRATVFAFLVLTSMELPEYLAIASDYRQWT